MSSSLLLFFFGPAINNFNITHNGSPIATSSIPIPYVTSAPIESQRVPNLPVRRADYTYTPGVGAHKIHSVAKVWNEARLICKDEGGDLAIINSLAESEVIAKLFNASLPHINSEDSEYALIGFHDLYEEGQYVTIHGDSLKRAGFEQWSDGEPNNGGNIEHCGSVYYDGKLNDIRCKLRIAFVCELPDSELDWTSTESASDVKNHDSVH